MTNTTRAVRGGLLAALVLLPLASSAPAQATFPDNWLYVTVARGDARAIVEGTVRRRRAFIN